MNIIKIKYEAIMLIDKEDEQFKPYWAHQFAQEIDSGAGVGTFVEQSREAIPEDRVRDELLAIGNDGTFFDVVGD